MLPLWINSFNSVSLRKPKAGWPEHKCTVTRFEKKNQPNNRLLYDFWQQLDGLFPPIKWNVLAACGGSLKYIKRIIFLREGVILTEVQLTHFQICTLNVSVKWKMNIISYEISCPWLQYALSCSIVSFSTYSYVVVYFRTSCAVVS